MKIGKVKRVIRNVPKPIIIRNWPKPKSNPIKLPKKEPAKVQ